MDIDKQVWTWACEYLKTAIHQSILIPYFEQYILTNSSSMQDHLVCLELKNHNDFVTDLYKLVYQP